MNLLQILVQKHMEVFYMNNGTVKWFNAEKVLVSLNKKWRRRIRTFQVSLAMATKL